MSLMQRMAAAYILLKGSTVTLADGTEARCGFNDTPSKIQSDEVEDGSKPSKQSVTFTLADSANVGASDVLTYQGARYRVDRVIRHGASDEVTTQVAVCDYM